MIPELSPGDGQCLPGEVGGRGIDVLGLDVDVVEDRDGLVPFNLHKGAFSIPWIPGSRGIVRVVICASMRSIAP